MKMSDTEIMETGMKLAGLDLEALLVAKGFMMGSKMLTGKQAIEEHGLMELLKLSRERRREIERKGRKRKIHRNPPQDKNPEGN